MQGLDKAAAPVAPKAKEMLDEIGGHWWNAYIGGPRNGGEGWTRERLEQYEAVGITRFLLTYVGRQQSDVPLLTFAQGEADGADAVGVAAGVGYGAGTPLCLDVEGKTFDASPTGAVAYAAGWCRGVRAAGLRPGVYSNPRMFVPLAQEPERPDWIWIAHWKRHDVNPAADPHNGPGLKAALWGEPGQRAWQYAGTFVDPGSPPGTPPTKCLVGDTLVDIDVAPAEVLASRILEPARSRLLPPPVSDGFQVGRPVPGYRTAADAAARRNSNSTVPAGHYAIFNTSQGMINVTRQAGTPGFWINPGDLQAAPPPPPVSDGFDVGRPVPGYRTAADAAARRNSNSTVPVGHYAIFNTSQGMVNVTRRAGTPGFWINPGDLG